MQPLLRLFRGCPSSRLPANRKPSTGAACLRQRVVSIGDRSALGTSSPDGLCAFTSVNSSDAIH
jgi:hypothetical protein